eukprot:SAG31_NODE_15029_length_774_cov_1.074074_1_plen_224_part_01
MHDDRFDKGCHEWAVAPPPPKAAGMTTPLELVPASPSDFNGESSYVGESPGTVATDFEREYDAFVRLAPPAVQAPSRPGGRGASTADMEALYAAFEREIRASLSPNTDDSGVPSEIASDSDPVASLLAASDAAAAADNESRPARRREGKSRGAGARRQSRQRNVYGRLQDRANFTGTNRIYEYDSANPDLVDMYSPSADRKDFDTGQESTSTGRRAVTTKQTIS